MDSKNGLLGILVSGALAFATPLQGYAQEGDKVGLKPQISTEKCGLGTVLNSKTDLCVTEISNTYMNWYEAKDYCRELNSESREVWRLPTRIEAEIISDFRDVLPFDVITNTDKKKRIWHSGVYSLPTWRIIIYGSDGVADGTEQDYHSVVCVSK